MPRFAALSIAERSAVISVGFASASVARLLKVRIRVTTLRFLSERLSVWRARLAADFVFAIDRGLEAHGSREFCQQTNATIKRARSGIIPSISLSEPRVLLTEAAQSLPSQHQAWRNLP